ncbi:MAG: hypothetical protein CVV51_02750 [Spirochaetae bacterium HGW-Spirochaetae-7]|jgi:hypothetical protein|nr:MAG: hypothetical protein CVV51_02750 [Spirochaetae bacterium HGW-Spirochaetae-7]
MRRKFSSVTIVQTLAVSFAALFMASSCGASAALAVRADRSATLSVSLEVPAAVEAKLRQFVASGAAASGAASVATRPLFDPDAVAASMRARGFAVEESTAPTPRSWRGTFRLADLGGLVSSDPELSKAVGYERGAGWASLSVSLSRGNAGALARLFPGIDADLLEALQPPALFDNPVSAAEYRSMLSGLLGMSAVAAIDGMAFTLAVSLPGPALERGGSARLDAARRTASLTVPALEAMVLERPVEFFVKWSQ